MTPSPTWIGLLEWAATICELAGHWFVQSTLLIAAGLLAGKLFANRGPALASAIYRTTIVAAFLCPIVTWFLAQFGMTLGIATLPELRVSGVEMVAVTRLVEAPPAAPPVRVEPPIVPEPAIVSRDVRDAAPIGQGPTMSEMRDAPGPERMSEASSNIVFGSNPAIAVPEPAHPSAAEASPAPAPRLVEVVEMVSTTVLRPWIAVLVGFLAASWLIITALFLLRLLVAHVHLLRLRRAAHPAPADQQQLCWQVAEKVGAWPPPVLCSPFVAGPCLAGVFRPAILLPDELPELPLATVFVHELAHLRRRDCLWNVVRQVVCAVLFFQPLVWLLSRRLEMSAEEVCDDHVVEHGADRGTYADILVSLAERTLLPASSAVVPLVTFRSLLGRRVARILDRTRRLSLSVSLTALALIVAAGLAATLGTGALGPAGRGVPTGAAVTAESDSAATGERESATASSEKETIDADGGPAVAAGGTQDAAGENADDVVLHYRGRVVDTDERPIAGAKVFLTRELWNVPSGGFARHSGTTDANGWFDFPTRREDFPADVGAEWLSPGVVVVADGFGCAQAASLPFETTGAARRLMSDDARRRAEESKVEHDTILHLTRDDTPLTGRLVSSEGKPLVGIQVAAKHAFYSAEGNLDAWEAAARDPQVDLGTLIRIAPRGGHVNDLSTFFTATTDRDGRFGLPGVGRDRVVDLIISGANLETTPLRVRTRAGDQFSVPYQWAATPRTFEPRQVFLANNFVQAIPYSQPVTGRVTDAQTGEPLAGVLISSGTFGPSPGGSKPQLTTRTDADGRYVLHGMMVGDEQVVCVRPALAEAYVPAGEPVTTSLDKPSVRDFKLRRGIWLQGKVTDPRTGKPLPGEVSYSAFTSNISLALYPGFARYGLAHQSPVDETGHYKLAIPPGPGVVTFRSLDWKRFRSGVGKQSITQKPLESPGNPTRFAAVPHYVMPDDEHFLRQIHPKAEADHLEVEIAVEAGVTVPIRLVDADGKSIDDAECSGVYPEGFWEPVKGKTFDLMGYYPDEPRDLFFYDIDHDLSAYYRLEGPAPGELTVVLKPATRVRGRLLDENGLVLPRVQLGWREIPFATERKLQFSTDDEGNFEIRGLVPRHKYMARAASNMVFGDLFFESPAEPGQTKDLGDVKLVAAGTTPPADMTTAAADKRVDATTAGAPDATSAADDNLTLHYHGRVITPDGRPAAGAKIFFYYWLQGVAPRGDLAPLAVTGADGEFDFSAKTSDFDPLAEAARYNCGIVAAADGYGFARGSSLDFETTGEARKRLPQKVLDYLKREHPEQPGILQLVRDDAPLAGQIVTIDGTPVAGARVRLRNVMLQSAAKGGDNLDGWEKEARDPKAGFYSLRNNHVPVEINTWQLPSIVHDATADAEGRFTMRGIGRERVAELMISGPGIETSLVKTRTRDGEMILIGRFGPRAMGRSERTDAVYPNQFTFAAGPSKPIMGRVTDADTSTPIPGVRVSLGQTGTFMGFGKDYIACMTDADGRYRLEGIALDDSESIVVWPAAGSGYVPSGTTVKLALDKPAPEKDFELRKGVRLRGQAIDKATGQPIPGRVQYFARSNNPNLKSYPRLANARLSYEARSDTEGRFEIAVPPGPGIVTYLAMNHTRYRRGQGVEAVSGGTDVGGTFGGKTYRVVPSMLFDRSEIFLQEVNPSEGDQQVEVTLPIESGLDVYGKLVDQQGVPVAGGLIGNAVFANTWYTHSIRDDTFHVEGYYPDSPRDLFFYNPERDLAGQYHLAGPPPENLVVRLAPAGAIRGRLIDKQGGALPQVELSGEGVPTTHEKPELFLATDDDGNFFIRGLIAGRKYTVEGRGGDNYGQLFADVTVEAGQIKDVGDVTLTRPEPKKNATAAGAGGSNSKSTAAAALFGGKAAKATGATGGSSTGPAKKQGATGGFQAAMKAQTPSGPPQSDAPKATHTFVPASAVPAKKHDPEPAGDIIRVAGRVVDPSGQAAAGADVMVAGWYWRSSGKREPIAATKTDASGRFAIEYRKSQLPELGESRGWKYANIVATKPGCGAAWISYEDIKPGEEPTLRLVKVEPLEGRVVDLEGKPIAGVQVELLNLRANKADDLSRWIERIRENANASGGRMITGVVVAGSQRKMEPTPEQEASPNNVLNADIAPVAAKATTDADGRFHLSGIGHDRWASLQLSGSGIVIATLNVVTRPMEKIPNAGFGIFDRTLYGARFEYAAEPSQPIEGVIRDAKTHKPIPRVRVVSDTFAGTGIGGVYSLETVADGEGRYRLVGMPKGEGNKIVALPGDDQPYFVREFDVPTGAGIDPVKFDMELHRGLWISGRVTSAATGSPVRGQLYYVPWPDNSYVQGLPEFERTPSPGLIFHRHVTDAEGNYRLVGMPGRGLVTVRVNDDHPYPLGQGLRAIADLPSENSFSRVGALFAPTKSSPTAGVEVRPTEQDEEITAHIGLVDGIRVSLALVDTEGKPLAGVTARGLWPADQLHEENDAGPTVEVRALWPDEQRRVFLHHDERKLGKSVLVNATENGAAPIQVKLEPCATVAMRLIDGEGQPVQAVVRFEAVGESLQGLYWENTDEDGRLTNTMVPAGCDYVVHCQSPPRGFVTIAKRVSVAPGETIDLGEIDITKEERPEISRTPAATSGNSNSVAASGATGGSSTSAAHEDGAPASATEQLVITGQVLDPDGRPVHGADVALQGHRWDWFNPGPNPDRTKTDAQGNFRIEVSSAQYAKGEPRDWPQRARIVASADGFGMSGVKYSELGAEKHAVIRLVPDEPIEGRIVNLEGQPVAGVKVNAFSVTTNDEQDITAWVTALRDGVPFHSSQQNGRPHNELTTDNESSRYAATSRYTTDADGRFRITGIGRNRFVRLNLAGGGVVATDLRVVTLPIATFNMKWYADDNPPAEPIHGAKFQFVAEPSPPIEGVVRDAKTGEPLAGVKVWSETFSGHRVSGDFRLKAISDDAGHYRLEGMPRGSGNRIAAIPGDEQPYFMRQFDVPAAEKLEAIQCDLELHRGVMVSGRVTAQSTGKPLYGRVEYIPDPDNPHIVGLSEFNSRNLPGPQWRYETDDQGNYSIVALPGRGYLGLSVVTEVPAPAHQGLEQIANLPKPEAFAGIVSTLHTPHSQWYTAVRELNIGEQDERAAADFEVSSGERVPLQLIDSAGQAIAGAEAYGLWPREQHHIDRELPATIDVVGLRPDEKRRVLLYHKERNLSGALLVCKQESGEASVTAKLLPCATVTGRLLDKDGQPLEFTRLGFMIPDEWNYSLNFPTGVTDKEGRFTVNNLPTGCAWDISVSEHSRLTQFVEALEPQPGETIDLGEIDITSDKRPAMKRSVATAPAATPGATGVSSISVAADDHIAPPATEGHVFAGRVVAPDGRPVTEARVWLMRYSIGKTTERHVRSDLAETKTDVEGRFRFDQVVDDRPVSDGEAFLRSGLVIVATAAGFGPGWNSDTVTASKDTEIKLVPARQAARGQILDLEGKPVSGAQVRVIGVGAPHADMPGWLAKAKLNPPGLTDAQLDAVSNRRSTKPAVVHFPSWPTTAVPDALSAPFVANDEGRVDLGTWGDNRLLHLELTGPGIAKGWVQVITYPMAPVPVPTGDPRYLANSYFGADFQVTVEPEQVIRGQVTDVENGLPMVGAKVRLHQLGGHLLMLTGFVSATTDSQGNYELRGLPKPKRGDLNHKLEIYPGTDSPYFRTETVVPQRSGFAPVVHNVTLRRGLWLSGRATEQSTGQPLRGAVSFYPFLDNDTAAKYANFDAGMRSMGYDDHYATASDGTYRLPAIAGRGVLVFTAENPDDYPVADGLDRIPGLKGASKDRRLNVYHFDFADMANALREVNVAPDAREVRVNMDMPSFADYSLRFLDVQGEPVNQVLAQRLRPVHPGIGHNFGWDGDKSAGSTVTLRGFEELAQMPIIALARDKNLGGVRFFQQSDFDDAKGCDWRLEPCAVVKGRLLDANGKPLPKLWVTARWNPFIGEKERALSHWWHNTHSQQSDADGNFSLPSLPPGASYELSVHSLDLGTVELGKTDVLAPGALVDRGDITCKAADVEVGAMAAGSDAKGVSAPQKELTHVRGRIINADGQPVAGADVAVIAARISPEVSGPHVSQKIEIPAEGKSDAEGRFAFSFPKLSSETHDAVYTIARGPSLGMGYTRLKPDDGTSEVELKLQAEEAIRGRIVNIDGQPGAGVSMTIQGIIPRSGEESWTNGIYLSEAKACPAIWPTLSPTDTEGRFEIHGVPTGYKIYLQVQGTEQFAPQSVTLNSGQPEQRTERDGTYRALVKDATPGEEIVLALAPSQWFEGTVRYADTGEPAPHAKVSIWASQEEYGSMSSVHGETDDQGQYRINPNPGIRFGVNAFGPVHTPYLNYQMPQNEAIEWRSGERVHKVDVTLPRGVMVRGTIVEADSEKPIAGAAVEYIPERESNPNVTDHILTGWQDMRPSDASGRFEIVVLPGPGRLLVHGPGNSYILREIGERELARSKRGGQRNYAHAFEKVDPQKNQESLEVKLSLTRGATIHGRIVDEQGEPVDDALVVSGLHIRPFWLNWHAYTEPTSGSRFELSGMEADHEYPVYVLEPKRRLGAAVTLKASDDDCTVVLHPCVEATARFVGTDGTPRQDIYPTLQVVMKPGGYAHNFLAQRFGEMAADADFMANLDRVNYAHGPGTNADGRVTFPALIPGAKYHLLGARKGSLSLEREFVAPATGTIDLGEFKYDDERK